MYVYRVHCLVAHKFRMMRVCWKLKARVGQHARL